MMIPLIKCSKPNQNQNESNEIANENRKILKFLEGKKELYNYNKGKIDYSNPEKIEISNSYMKSFIAFKSQIKESRVALDLMMVHIAY